MIDQVAVLFVCAAILGQRLARRTGDQLFGVFVNLRIKCLLLVAEERAHVLIDEQCHENEREADKAHENHLVRLTLPYALLPYVELDAALLFEAPGAHSVNIIDQPFENALGRERAHRHNCVPERGEVERRRIDGVLAVVDEVEHLLDNLVLDQVVDVHDQHEVHRILLLACVQDRLPHQPVEVIDIALQIEVAIQALLEVVHEFVARALQRVDVLLLDFPADLVDE